VSDVEAVDWPPNALSLSLSSWPAVSGSRWRTDCRLPTAAASSSAGGCGPLALAGVADMVGAREDGRPHGRRASACLYALPPCLLKEPMTDASAMCGMLLTAEATSHPCLANSVIGCESACACTFTAQAKSVPGISISTSLSSLSVGSATPNCPIVYDYLTSGPMFQEHRFFFMRQMSPRWE
jgi:hypothetical protein